MLPSAIASACFELAISSHGLALMACRLKHQMIHPSTPCRSGVLDTLAECSRPQASQHSCLPGQDMSMAVASGLRLTESESGRHVPVVLQISIASINSAGPPHACLQAAFCMRDPALQQLQPFPSLHLLKIPNRPCQLSTQAVLTRVLHATLDMLMLSLAASDKNIVFIDSQC